MKVRVWKLDEEAVLSRLKEWAQALAENSSVRAVVLFGSLARGEATAASDADVLILLEDSERDFGDRMMEFKPMGLGISVEVFPYTLLEARNAIEDHWGMVEVALREGQVLFGRDGWKRDSMMQALAG